MKVGWRFKGSLMAMGVIALAVIGLVSADVGCTAVGGTRGACGGVTAFAKALGPWQTLLTGAFALIAAAFAGWYVLLQVSLADRQEAGRILRRHRAQTAVMPLVLSSVCDYVEQSVEAYHYAYGLKAAGQALTRDRFLNIDLPELDPSVAAGLRDMIEASPETEDVSAYVELLSDLQTHAARWRGFRSDLGKNDEGPSLREIGNEIAEAAAIYAQASNLFDHVRPASQVGIGDRAPTTAARALVLLGVYENVPEAYDVARAFDGAATGRPSPRA
ncbi:hypothetical protein [Caulobacter soli]|uniref:hypothetical protein n=1 Tax=Caulobacter soli TaxID=2708539 RepID=UPI0013EC0A19|nr:hypothetical protein [Caulobacter soli]